MRENHLCVGSFESTAQYPAGGRETVLGRRRIPALDYPHLFGRHSKKLVACLKPDLLPEQPPDPNSSKPITSRHAYEHSIAPDQDSTTTDLPPEAEADLCDAFHASLGVYKAASQPDRRPLKSSVSPAHPARFLADNPEVLYKKDGNTCIPVGSSSVSAKFHYGHVPDDNSTIPAAPHTLVCHSNQTSVSTPGYAMVDRGVNGCIMGNDACIEILNRA
eukprot:jgi/Psemu1/10731/gm1.10731_g